MAFNSIAELEAALPLVCGDEDLGLVFDWKPRTVRKKRALGLIPVPELPRVDRRHRFSRADIVRFVQGETRAEIEIGRRRR